jgi:hypothetical protein
MLLGPKFQLLPAGWTVTPDEILFVGAAGDSTLQTVRGYRMASGELRTVIMLLEIPERGTDLSVSPDSRWLLYTQLARSGSNIMLAETAR